VGRCGWDSTEEIKCGTTIELRNLGKFLCKIKFKLEKQTMKIDPMADEECEGQVEEQLTDHGKR